MPPDILAARAAMLAIGMVGIATVYLYMRNIERLARSRAYWFLGLGMIVFCGLIVPNLQAAAAVALEGSQESQRFFMTIVFSQGILMMVIIFGTIWRRRRR